MNYLTILLLVASVPTCNAAETLPTGPPPEYCAEVGLELRQAVARGEITSVEAMKILTRCEERGS